MAPARKAVRIPMPEISGIDLRPLVKRPRPQRPPEGRKRDNDPLHNGGQAGIDDRNDRHDVTIGPTLPDLDVQPFAEERVGKAQNAGDSDHSTARYIWTSPPSAQNENEPERA